MSHFDPAKPLYTGILIELRKVPALRHAFTVLAVAGPAAAVHEFHGLDHRKLEAVMPSQDGSHDDDPVRPQIRELGERHARTFASGAGVASQMPFRQMDWPNPIAAAYPTDLRTWAQAPSLSLVTASSA